MENENKKYIDSQLKRIEDQQKTNKAIFLTSTAVSLFTAALALGNFASGNELQALQNTGTTIALGCYTIGYHHLFEINNFEKNNRLKELENGTDYITQLKNRLIKLKTTINRYKIYKNINLIAGSGFSLATISNIIRSINPEQGDNLALTTLSALISGVVAYLNFNMLAKTKGYIKYNEEELSFVEEQLEENQKLQK